jgi:hypothetical protein
MYAASCPSPLQDSSSLGVTLPQRSMRFNAENAGSNEIEEQRTPLQILHQRNYLSGLLSGPSLKLFIGHEAHIR